VEAGGASLRRLPLLPPMRCDDGCGECCGIVPVTETEFQRVRRFVEAQGIVPVNQGPTCPFFQAGRCAVYEARPMICRIFGHIAEPTGRCPRGYSTEALSDAEGTRLVRSNGPTLHLLHELIPGFVEEAEANADRREVLASRQ